MDVALGAFPFEERSIQTGVRQASLRFTGFGAAWLDVDNDGWLDLLMVNGAVSQNRAGSGRHEGFALQQRKLLLHLAVVADFLLAGGEMAVPEQRHLFL